MKPKISINLCCYNSEKFLYETLNSIIKQTYQNWELIIINDGSSDSTESIINDYIKRGFPITYYFQKNKGVGFSRNIALKVSKGEYVAFIDHDDIWMPDYLNKQILFLENNPEIDFIYTNFFMLNQQTGRMQLAHKKSQPSGYVFERFLHRYPIGILTVVIRKKVIDKLDSFFDVKLKLAEEYDVFMRILHDCKASYLDEPLAIYRIHSNMLSLKYLENFPEEIEYVSEKLKKLDENDPLKYAIAFERQKVYLEYLKAKTKMARGDLKNARTHLIQWKFYDHKFFILYCLSYLPSFIWLFLRFFWQKGTFRNLV